MKRTLFPVPRCPGLLGLLAFSLATVVPLTAASFTAGNLVIVRVGTGTGSLVNTGNPIFLDEYTPSGTLVQSVALPTAASGNNKALVLSGTATSEGALTRSADGRFLVMIGYNSTLPGSSSLSGTTATAINRTLARVAADGTVDTSTALSDFSSMNNPRGATSADGTAFWVVGGASGVRYATLGASTSSDVSATVSNLRVLQIFGGQLYVSTGSGSALRVGTVGTGLPTTTGQTATNLPGYPTTGSPYAFFFADLDAGVAGLDTLYVADDGTGSGIQKYCLVGGTWTACGTITAAGVRGLTATVSGTTVTLFGTTGGSSATGGGSLYTATDATGYNGTVSGTATTVTLTPAIATNTAFRGIAFAPVSGAVAPAITTQPAAQMAAAGGNATFTVVASGSPTPTYQWRKGGANLTDGGGVAGATTATLTLTGVALADNNTTYDVVVTNASGSVTSAAVTLTVTGTVVAPAITTQPVAQAVNVGGTATFAVVATGTAPTYQWRKGTTNLANGGVVSGATTATLTLTGVAVGDAGNYNVLVTNSAGNVTSNDAALTVNTPPTIGAAASTTARLAAPAAGPAFVSAVLGDPTDPVKFAGVDFTVADAETAATALTVTAASSNATVVPNTSAALALSGTGATRNLKIAPAAAGYATIVVTVNDGTGGSATYTINFAASAASAQPTTTRFFTGTSDASTALALDANTMLVGDDENQGLRLYDRTNSGLPIATFDFTASLGLTDTSGGQPREVDIEGSTRIGNRLFWLGSQSNNSEGTTRPNRNRLFATDLTGTGASATLTYVGRYDGLKNDLIAWDQTNAHGLGANYFGFTASSAAGVPSEVADGSSYNLEGLEMAPDGTTAYLCFRSPLAPAAARAHGLIVPVTNFAALVGANPANGPATFGVPIQLALGGRGIRELRKNAANQYVIIAGPPAGSTGTAPANFRLYTWDGNPANAPQLRAVDLTALNAGGSFEGIVEVPASLGDTSTLQLLLDCGDTVYYGDGIAAKNLAQPNFKKFRTETVTLGAVIVIAPPAISTQPTAQSTSPGGSVSFAVVASGTSPLSYQWRKGGVNLANGGAIAGATTATLTITGVVLADNGTTYDVVVTNAAGAATSAAATLTVTATGTAPTIGTQPVAAAAMVGGGVSLSVVATGTAPISYQWRKDGTAITAATSATLSLSSLAASDGGAYSVVVTNSGGSVTSNAVPLNIVVALQSVAGDGYLAGGTVTLVNTLACTGALSGGGWQMLLPADWSYAGGSSGGATTAPVAGTKSLAEWHWSGSLAAPKIFTANLSVPAGRTGPQTINAVFTGQRTDGSTFQVLVQPDPMTLHRSALYHHADTNQDRAIGLAELLRMIELYNHREGTVRLGSYRLNAGTEDGFAPGR